MNVKEEIEKIINDGPKDVHFTWGLSIENPHKLWEPLKLISIDIKRDYDTSFADYILIDTIFPLGTYLHHFLPYKEELIATLIRYRKSECNDSFDDDEEDKYERMYTAIMTTEESDMLRNAQYHSHDAESANIAETIRLQFQLMDIGLEEMRFHEVGGIYRNSVPLDVARYVLTKISNELDLPEEEEIKGVDIYPPDNEEENVHIILPHGIRPMDVPAYIQDNWGGIYNTGISCYLQDKLWYIWPTFFHQRFEEEERSLIIYNLPSTVLPGSERTYREEDEKVHLIATREAIHSDYNHFFKLNHGTGTRFAHGYKLMNAAGETKENKHTVERKENNSEYESIRRPPYHVSPVAPIRITNNQFSQVSKLAVRDGSILELLWENSKPELIYPGMPAKVIFFRDNEPEEILGIVLRVHHYIYDNNYGIVKGRFICNSYLAIFVEIFDDDDEEGGEGGGEGSE